MDEKLHSVSLALEAIGAQVLYQQPLSEYSTFAIGGPAAVLCLPHTVSQLADAVEICRKGEVKHFVIGRGSNLLFADEGYDGVILCTRHLNEIRLGDGKLRCAAGALLSSVCGFACSHGITGFEFAYGIPGTVGGAVFMNAGAYDGEIRDVILSADVIDEAGNLITLSANELDLGYRCSALQGRSLCLVSAEFKANPGDARCIRARMDELMAKRKEKQPLEYPSAGSTFKRPEGAFAAKLIQDCGLKGYRCGDAAVSEKHSGFVVNLGHATAADVLQVIGHVAQTVKQSSGFSLETEILYIR